MNKVYSCVFLSALGNKISGVLSFVHVARLWWWDLLMHTSPRLQLRAKWTYGLVQVVDQRGESVWWMNVIWGQTVEEDHYLSAEGLILSSRVLEELGSLLLLQTAGLAAENISISRSRGLPFLSHCMCAWTCLITKGNCIQSISIFGEDRSRFVFFLIGHLDFFLLMLFFLFYFRLKSSTWRLGKISTNTKNKAFDLKKENTKKKNRNMKLLIFWRQS